MAIEVKLPRKVSGAELAKIFEEEAYKTKSTHLLEESEIQYEPGSVKEVIKGQILTAVQTKYREWKFLIFSGLEYLGAYHIKTSPLVPSEQYGSFQLTVEYAASYKGHEPNFIVNPGHWRWREHIEPTVKDLIARIYQRLEPATGN